jgi:hypothetical protein
MGRITPGRTMTHEPSASEQRVAKRQRVLKTGKILMPNNMSVIDCTVRDLSTTGARLICHDQAAVPNAFRLVTPADNLMRDAEVKWRRGEEIGIRFTGEPRRAPPRKL